MRNRIKKIMLAIIVMTIFCVIGICITKNIYNNSPVEFKDETMKNVIVESCAKQSGIRGTSHKDLRGLSSLNIGYVGYYDTLEDIRWCTDIEELYLNGKLEKYDYEAAYQIAEGKVPKELTEDKVNQFQRELGEILPKLNGLRKVVISGKESCAWNSVDFFKGCNQIEKIEIYNIEVTDYSALKECKSLKSLIIYNSPISKAEDLMGLENIERISIDETPLEGNKEEIEKLQKEYPDAEIVWY